MLRVLSHLNYKAWFALAEFVDNAVQSHIEARTQNILEIDIDFDSGRDSQIVVRDNAAGIRRRDFPRAFKPASAPPNPSGLSEFGMGMKSAAYWFADRWEVVTSSAGDERAYSVEFDVDEITRDDLETVRVNTSPTEASSHFTEVRLKSVRHMPVGRTIGKIKEHLRDIYREFIDSGSLVLRVNGQKLEHRYPDLLVAPIFSDLSASPQTWKIEIDFEFAEGKRATGFVALRDPGSTKNTGLSLFRRGRIIQGSADEGYKPQSLFGGGNSYESQRVFGDIHLHGFGVSHTKDGFQWDGAEEEFLERLKDVIDGPALPLLKQARGFRKFEYGRTSRRHVQEAITRTGDAVQNNLESALPGIIDSASPAAAPVSDELDSSPIISKNIEFRHEGVRWEVDIGSSAAMGPDSWYSRSIERTQESIQISVQLNMSHPFIIRFCQRDAESLEAVTRLAVSLAVGEVTSRLAGVTDAQAVVAAVNSVVSRVLSGE
ncbi:ATP-binding protein [Curtobacterium sp. MCLR17_039]|nr:ATP-binding protein [Curtobacterium sp. MCLR17_039]